MFDILIGQTHDGLHHQFEAVVFQRVMQLLYPIHAIL